MAGLLEHLACAVRRGVKSPRAPCSEPAPPEAPALHPPEGSWELAVQVVLQHLPRALTAVQGGPGLAWAAAAKEIQGVPAWNHPRLSCFSAVLL